MAVDVKAEVKRLICPGCGGTLNEVWAEATYGRVLLLDQCAECGGVWFDRWELYFVEERSLRSLGGFDAKSLLAPNPDRKGRNACPRCAHELTPFVDALLPRDALIERCASCNGLWLNRGELTRYAAHKEAIKVRLNGGGKQAVTPKTAEVLPFAGALNSSWEDAGEKKNSGLEVLKNLQKELNVAGLAPMSTLKELEASNLQDEGSVETKEVAKDIGFLVLQSLLRLVFKF